MQLEDINRKILLDDSGDLIIGRSQEITSDFLSDLADSRNAAAGAPMGDMVRVASIPNALVEKWYNEGFNIFDPNVDAAEILRRLRIEEQSQFLARDINL